MTHGNPLEPSYTSKIQPLLNLVTGATGAGVAWADWCHSQGIREICGVSAQFGLVMVFLSQGCPNSVFLIAEELSTARNGPRCRGVEAKKGVSAWNL